MKYMQLNFINYLFQDPGKDTKYMRHKFYQNFKTQE